MFDREQVRRPGAPASRRSGAEGKPLDAKVRVRLEPAFGLGLAHLRVHEDEHSQAELAARGADGAALGRDLAFARGAYRPGTLAGDALIAHEVAHALQQSGGASSRDEGALEADADRSALAALLPGAAGGAARPRLSAAPGLSLTSCSGKRSEQRAGGSATPATTAAPGTAPTTAPAAPSATPTTTAADWDFTVADLQALRARGGDVSMAPDSGWFPAPLQTNLLATLRALLDPSRSPRATEGVNVRDWYHGHFGVPSGAWTDELQRLSETYRSTEEREERAVFGENREVTAANLPSYREAMGRITAAAGPMLARAVTLPGAAVLYHTYELTGGVAAGAARRNWRSPLDSNVPEGVASGRDTATYMSDLGLREVLQFAFLVDTEGRVHVRPGSTFELRTVTGEPGFL